MSKSSAPRMSEDDLTVYLKKRKTPPSVIAKSKPSKRNMAKSIASMISCHAKALGLLLRFPVLRDGGLYRGKKVQANHEHWDQVMIFDFVERKFPVAYQYLAAMPNGGHRSKKTAVDLEAEGVKSGYPDMLLDLPKGRYHGMRIELKRLGGGLPSDNQKVWLNRLNEQGYFVVLAYGFDDAVAAIGEYLALDSGQEAKKRATMAKWLLIDG